MFYGHNHGRPWELIKTTDAGGRTVEIIHHYRRAVGYMDYLPGDDFPHYHGPRGESIYYRCFKRYRIFVG